jgi:N-methylhydantoinase A
MLLSDAKESFKLSRICRLAETGLTTFDGLFVEMEAEGRERMRRSGFADAEIRCVRTVEMRYTGQEFTLRLPFAGTEGSADPLRDLRERFGALHELRYGHAFEKTPTEVVALEVEAYGLLPKPTIALQVAAGPIPPAESREVYFEDEGFVTCQVVRRATLAVGSRVDGPAVIEEEASTTLIHPGDSVTVDAAWNLVVTVATIDALERAAARWARSMA